MRKNTPYRARYGTYTGPIRVRREARHVVPNRVHGVQINYDDGSDNPFFDLLDKDMASLGRSRYPITLGLLEDIAQGPQCVPPLSPPEREHKADTGKPDWSLLLGSQGCPNALAGVVDVLTIAVRPKDQGGRGYDKHSWRLVTNAKERYLAALGRHLSKVALGEVMDDGPEGTGKSHWDCICANALFLRELHEEDIRNATA